ncbi:ATP-binding protein [Hymenobacter rubripertinctus]|uniref:histidine kinase n=1 Tax=Hymenobacter rubripertinctus TaxID=2029981 RepID=A0A418R3B1_9BACT|nr:ATP-binding protein [Hymenobacter rubripertinctus]RIY11844.1 GAF domain-containing protein [Hymenobacter rubripertinctus]
MDRIGHVLTDESLQAEVVTLTNCDREPIHIPGSIQPYGFLLCLDPRTQRVVQASANTADMVGLAADDLIGQDLSAFFSEERLRELAAQWVSLTENHRLQGVRLNQLPGQPFFKLIQHRFDDLLWLEFEPVEPAATGPLDLPSLNEALSQMLGAESVLEFCQHAVQQISNITGFDRVMMYRFADDESGEVVAEVRAPGLEPFLGLRYPATDIPQQARAMYLRNWLRFIAEVGYVPVPLVPVRTPATGRPPDMTYAVLRSVSPIHVQYLRNMGVQASMSVSLIRDGKLWGLIVCHHNSPRLVSYELRDLCQFIGKTFSSLLKSKEQAEDYQYQLRLRQTQADLFARMAELPDFRRALYDHAPTVMDLFRCGGVAVCFDQQTATLGATPTPEELGELMEWLHLNAPEEVFHTNSYARLHPAGVKLRAVASGIMAICLDRQNRDYILWFRPEVVQQVTWAGRREKPETTHNGELFLSPRQSFAAWSESVENTAEAWRSIEVAAAQELRLRIADIRLKMFDEVQARATLLGRLNEELERSNEELDSFAYVASHDLKEPLRGIHNYSLFLLEDYADKLDAEGVEKLQTLIRLSKRMENLIESLLKLSRVSRLETRLHPVRVADVLHEVRDMLQVRLAQTATTLEIEGELPVVLADAVRLGEVLNNLLTNAMRYNDNAHPYVWVGVAPATVQGPRGSTPPGFCTLYVRDNGIGIDPRHHENIFRIFKRLHGPNKYGGGTGAGLAIARKMIEKMGGQIWVDSVAGQGATFYFSVPTPH